MSRTEPTMPDPEVAGAELADIIHLYDRFALVFCLCASETAVGQHIFDFRERFPDIKVAQIPVPYPNGQIIRLITEAYEKEQPQAIFVSGMDVWTSRSEEAKTNEFTAALNIGRDSLAATVPMTIVFWCTQPVLNYIRRTAHDFFSVQTATLRFSLNDERVPSYPDYVDKTDSALAASLTSEERKRRIVELEELRTVFSFDSGNEATNLVYISLCCSLAQLYDADDRIREAIEVVSCAKDIAEKKQLQESWYYLRILQNLGYLYHSVHNLSDALNCYEKCIEIRYKIRHDISSTDMYNCADVLFEQGEYLAARLLMKQAILLDDSRLNLAISFAKSGTILYVLGDLTQARALLESALRDFEEILGGKHLWTAKVMRELGQLALKEGNATEARSWLEQASRIFEDTDRRMSLALALINMGRVALVQKRISEARALMDDAIDTLLKFPDLNRIYLPTAQWRRAEVALAEGDHELARKLANEARTALRKVRNPYHPETMELIEWMYANNLTEPTPPNNAEAVG